MSSARKKKMPNGITFGMVSVIIIAMAIILILTTVKTYLSNQIYYESKVVNKMAREVSALKAEKIMLKQSVEALRFKKWATACICDPQAMRCTCGKNNAIGKAFSSKPVTATKEELKVNPRSRSAKLRSFRFKKNV